MQGRIQSGSSVELGALCDAVPANFHPQEVLNIYKLKKCFIFKFYDSVLGNLDESCGLFENLWFMECNSQPPIQYLEAVTYLSEPEFLQVVDGKTAKKAMCAK